MVADRIRDVVGGCACLLWAHCARCGLPVGLGLGVIEKREGVVEDVQCGPNTPANTSQARSVFATKLRTM